MNIAKKVGPCPVEFLVSLHRPVVVDDPAQVEPRADHLVEADVDAAEGPAHFLQSAQASVIDGSVLGLRHGFRAMDPGNAVMPGDDQFFADPLDFHFSAALSHAEGLDGQQFSPARRLGDVAGCRQFGAVEIAHDLPAAGEVRHIGQENGLMDDRSPRALFAESRPRSFAGRRRPAGRRSSRPAAWPRRRHAARRSDRRPSIPPRSAKPCGWYGRPWCNVLACEGTKGTLFVFRVNYTLLNPSAGKPAQARIYCPYLAAAS